MTQNHLKRLNAPKTWPIKRKENAFITKPNAGAHPAYLGMPLSLMLKNLGYAKTIKEVKYLLNSKLVLIDGKRRKDHRFIIGLMDVLSIKDTNENFRVLLNQKGVLEAYPIRGDEANLKLCKIVNKAITKKRLQLNLIDGRNVLVDKDDYKVGDSLLIELPSQKIKECVKLEENCVVYLYKGKHTADIGVVKEMRGNVVVYKNSNGKLLETPKDYVFVVGKEKPVIQLANR